MHRARSRAHPPVPLPFLRRRHPFLAALYRWHLFRRWLGLRQTSLPIRSPGGRHPHAA